MFLIDIKSKIYLYRGYRNLFRIHSSTRNISVRVGFGSGSLDTKILNPFGYLINFDSGSVLLFSGRVGSVIRIRIFCPALVNIVKKKIKTNI